MILPQEGGTFSSWADECGLPKKSLYSVPEVSRVTGVPRSTLYAEIRAGRLDAFKPRFRTRGYLLLPGSVDGWLDGGR